MLSQSYQDTVDIAQLLVGVDPAEQLQQNILGRESRLYIPKWITTLAGIAIIPSHAEASVFIFLVATPDCGVRSVVVEVEDVAPLLWPD